MLIAPRTNKVVKCFICSIVQTIYISVVMENEVVETDETRTEKEPENATEGATHDSQPTEEVCFVETADAVKDCDLKNPDDTNKPPQCATNDDWLAEAPVRGSKNFA